MKFKQFKYFQLIIFKSIKKYFDNIENLSLLNKKNQKNVLGTEGVLIMEDDVDVRGLVMGPFQTLLSFFISHIFGLSPTFLPYGISN